jgi:hypothetical protein
MCTCGRRAGAVFPRTANGRLLQDNRSFAGGTAGRQLEEADFPDDPRFVTEAGDMAIKEYCQPADARTLAQRFRNLTREVPFWTACGESKWIEELHSKRGSLAGSGRGS